MIVLVQVLKIGERPDGCRDGSLESVVAQVSANRAINTVRERVVQGKRVIANVRTAVEDR